MKTNQATRWILLTILSMVLGSCAQQRTDEPRLFFTNVEDGEVLKSPVDLEWNTENFVLEPWGDIATGPIIREGAGHAHIVLDAPCIKAGETMPNPSDGSIRHLLLGSTGTSLTLPSGEHTLCLQAGNGAHNALPGDGLRDEITIRIEE